MTSTDFAIRDDICANYTRDKGSEVIFKVGMEYQKAYIVTIPTFFSFFILVSDLFSV